MQLPLFLRPKYVINALRYPTMMARVIDANGKKRVAIISRTPFSIKTVGQFEVTQEFSPESHWPDLEPIEFRTSCDLSRFKKGG